MTDSTKTKPTLADALIRLEANTDLSDSRKRDLRSAVTSTARMLQKSLAIAASRWGFAAELGARRVAI